MKHGQSHVTHVTHISKGVESLGAEQFDSLAQAFGFRKVSGYNSLGASELPSKVQNAVNDIVTNGDAAHWMSQDPNRHSLCAAAFGFTDPSRLSHVAQVEQRGALANKLSELAI